MKQLLAARKRGVHVEILVPGEHIDAWPVRSLARGYYGKLLRAGIHIYEYQPTMMHCKVMVVDELFSSVGSANFDPRSLYINDESNLNVLDTRFAREQLRVIKNDKKQSIRIVAPPSRWNPLTLPRRVAAQILAPQL
jgi:cardiolipin synthase